MLVWGRKVSKNYAIEMAGLLIYRDLADGLSLVEIDFSADWFKGDHNPQCGIRITLLNVTLFEGRLYNVNHVEDGSIPVRKLKCPKCGEEIAIRSGV